MKNSLDLKATLVPVGREIHAKPGQMLIVAAGVCIGVYTGDANVPVAPKVIEHRPDEKPKRGPGRPPKEARPGTNAGRAPAAGSNPTISKQPVRSVLPVIDTVRRLLREKGTVGREDIFNALGITERTAKATWRVRDAVAWLHHWGECTASGKNHDRRYHVTTRTAA